jgi:glycine oxidase
MDAHPDVLILGGGVIGLTAAYYLASEGVAVSVLDRGDFGQQASWAGAGIIPPGNSAGANSPIEQFRAISSGLFPNLSAILREETGIDNGYLVCGGIELAGDSELPIDAWKAEGIAFEILDQSALLRLEPELAHQFGRGYYFPGMAQVRNPRHIKALIAACESRAVGLMAGCRAFALIRSGNRIVGIETEQGKLVAEQFLLASGAWTDELLPPSGWHAGIVPVRGQIALLNTEKLGLRPIVLQGKRYLVPRTDGRVLIGSTEEEAGFDARPTAGGIAGLLSFAERTVPTLRSATMERCWAGLRPGSPDGLPFVGRVPGYDNLFIAAGHFRAGIQLSPATGVAMTELMLGRAPTLPIAAFTPDRARSRPVQTAFRS